MRKEGIALGVIAAISLAGTALAAPGGKGKGGGGGGEDPPAEPFEPAILYRYDGNKSTDLRFGNLAGDQAMLVHRADGITHFNLSSDVERRIAYVEGDTMYVRTWQTNDPGASFVSSPQAIFQGVRPTTMDFSPDDRWLVFNDEARDLYIYDFDDGSWAKVLDLPDDYFVHNLRWSPEGDAVFFYGGPGDPLYRGIWRVDVSGYIANNSNTVGQPTSVMESGVDFSGTSFTVSQPQSGATPMIVAVDAGQDATGVLALYDLYGTKISSMPWAVGRWWSFNCGNTMGVYEVSNSYRDTDLVISDLFGSTSTWATDNKIYQRAEWLGC